MVQEELVPTPFFVVHPAGRVVPETPNESKFSVKLLPVKLTEVCASALLMRSKATIK
jgi:hypothetical protein